MNGAFHAVLMHACTTLGVLCACLLRGSHQPRPKQALNSARKHRSLILFEARASEALAQRTSRSLGLVWLRIKPLGNSGIACHGCRRAPLT